MFKGSMVALVTPMQPDSELDIESLRRLVEWQIENGTDAIVVLGTTGESVTLNDNERDKIIAQAIEQVASRVPVIVGTGVNSTWATIHHTRRAMELGADACLLVTPYYNKPTQEGLYQHYKTVAEAVPIPQILYNVPSRTACDLLPETVIRLAALPNIVGIKEASKDIGRVNQILKGSQGHSMDLYSGDDASAMEFLKAGGKGVISVAANLAPKLMHEMCAAVLGGKPKRADEINQQLVPLYQQLFVESSPIPAKWALHEMGLIPSGIRLPLTVLANQYHDVVRKAMRQAKVI